MQFLHIAPNVQYAYSNGRSAIAEYRRENESDAWKLYGWLWDGSLRTCADARAQLLDYLIAFPGEAL